MSSKATRKAVVKKISDAQTGTVIGIQSFWSTDNIRIKIDALKALYKKHGLDEDKWFPSMEAVDAPVAFRKALREVKTEMTKHGYLLRPIVKRGEKIIWGVVKEDVDEVKEDLNHGVEAKVMFYAKTGGVHVSGAGTAKKLAEMVKERFEELTETFISYDIQRMLRKNVYNRMASVSMRKNGGIYFTPPQWLPIIEKLQLVVEELGDSEVGIVVVKDDGKHNVKTYGRSARRSLEEDLNGVREEIEDFKKKGNTREDTLQRRLEEYQELKKKCDMYAGMLAIKVGDLKQGIDDCEAQVRELIGQVQVDKAAKVEERKGGKAEAKPSLKEKAKLRRMRKVANG